MLTEDGRRGEEQNSVYFHLTHAVWIPVRVTAQTSESAYPI